jgi:hypothetical protein
MQYAKSWAQSTPLVAAFKISATVIVGQATISGGAGGQIDDATTTSLVDATGVVVGAAGGGSLTYSTTQGDTEGLVEVNSNPMAIFKSLMSGGATNNTALQVLNNTSQDTAGLTITDADVGTATMDNGIAWRSENASESRRITTFTSGVSIAVTVPFLNDIEVGDLFFQTPINPALGTAMQLTTTLDQTDASIAVGTGGLINPFELELNGASDSYALFQFADHFFSKSA